MEPDVGAIAAGIEAAATSSNAASPGAALKAAREAKHFSTIDIARKLRLSARQIEALERDDYAALPGKTFTRGFVRNYAKVVELDSDEIVALVEPMFEQGRVNNVAPPPKGVPFDPYSAPSRERKLAFAALFAAALIFCGYFIFSGILGFDAMTFRPKNGAQVPANVSLPVVVMNDVQPAAAVADVKPDIPEAPSISARAVLPPENVTLSESVSTEIAVSPTAVALIEKNVAAVPATEIPLPSGSKKLQLAFDRDAWVEIKGRGGKLLFSQLNAAGTQQTIVGYPPFDLVVGNAAGVRLNYGADPIDLKPFIKVEVARLTLN